MAEKKKISKWVFTVFAFCIFIAVTLGVYVSGFPPGWSPRPGAKDARIISAISYARTVMSDVYTNNGNYDNFSCSHTEMVDLCEEIDYQYGKVDGKEPVIVRDASNDSQSVCIYSPINKGKSWFKKEEYWCCADSKGHAGCTTIDPGNDGYCVEGESAVCPPILETVPF